MLQNAKGHNVRFCTIKVFSGFLSYSVVQQMSPSHHFSITDNPAYSVLQQDLPTRPLSPPLINNATYSALLQELSSHLPLPDPTNNDSNTAECNLAEHVYDVVERRDRTIEKVQ